MQAAAKAVGSAALVGGSTGIKEKLSYDCPL